jgi:NAD-dependent SIR2 family protein deacetylase
MQGVYVKPKADCPHVGDMDFKAIKVHLDHEVYCQPCAICSDLSENWYCLSCKGVFCSRYVNGHMAEHYDESDHPVAFSFSDASIWCYKCESYITNPQLFDLCRHFGEVKFGEHLGSSTQSSVLPSVTEVRNEMEEGASKVDVFRMSDLYCPFTREEFISGLRSKQFKKIAILTGAGISVAAGIPDFRSPGTGLYSRLQELGLPFAEAVFHLSYFRENPHPFYEVAKWFLTLEGKPTKAHRFIKHLHENQQLLFSCTQNIDGLELAAGLPEQFLIQAHGHLRTAHCIDCETEYPMHSFFDYLQRGEIFLCSHCEDNPPPSALEHDGAVGLIKPDIVFFGEGLPASFKTAADMIGNADLVIVMGTSLKVFPFAMLADSVFCPESIPMVLVNRENPGLYRNRMLFLEGDIETSIQWIADELSVNL